jgi:heme/copper-type cytochrome/quinol oxidase subunit 2
MIQPKHLLFSVALAAGSGAAQPQAISTEAWYAVPDARGVQLVNVECGNGVFDPREIVVKKGKPVEFSVRTTEDFQEFVSGFNPAKAIGKHKSSHSFTPTANGQFSLVCQKQGGGEDARVKSKKSGRLTVVPDE